MATKTTLENRDLVRAAQATLMTVDLRSVPKDLRDEVRDLRTRSKTIGTRLTEVLVAEKKAAK